MLSEKIRRGHDPDKEFGKYVVIVPLRHLGSYAWYKTDSWKAANRKTKILNKKFGGGVTFRRYDKLIAKGMK